MLHLDVENTSPLKVNSNATECGTMLAINQINFNPVMPSIVLFHSLNCLII
jgi:hypothetical protein